MDIERAVDVGQVLQAGFNDVRILGHTDVVTVVAREHTRMKFTTDQTCKHETTRVARNVVAGLRFGGGQSTYLTKAGDRKPAIEFNEVVTCMRCDRVLKTVEKGEEW